MFKGAKWIAKENIATVEEVKAAPMLRKEFKVKKKIKKATLYVCGLGLGDYYINGKRVTKDVLLTPISAYDKRVYYNKYDVTNLLKEGKNAIGAILGNGWYFVTFHRWDKYKPAWMHHPKLIVRLEIEYADGTNEDVKTDSSWKGSDSPILYNETKRGEIYDARLEQDGWSEPGFDDSAWQNAFVCRSPGGILQEMDIDPIRITKSYPAKKIGENVYDIGQNISGWVKIKVKGNPGDEVVISYAEVLKDDGTIDPERLNTIIGSATHTEKYILKGEGEEVWSPRFAYFGFRYLEVNTKAEIIEMSGEFLHTDLKQIGSFSCSDEMLNKIHSACCMAILSNAHGIITDCPTREQNGWTGDALLSIDQTLTNYDAVSIYKKWLVDICDTQRPNGQICAIAPGGGWGYNWGSGPSYDSMLIYAPYLVYEYTGDTSLIEKFWDNMLKLMSFMEEMAEDNILHLGLGDWCVPKGVEPCSDDLINNAYFYIDYVIMAECAKAIGKDGSKLEKRAEEIRMSIREKFMKDDIFLNDSITGIACGIYQNLYTEEEKPVAAKHLAEVIEKDGYHMSCGIFGTKYVFDALSNYGYADVAYKMATNPEMPSYAHWINAGMTTICERWEADITESCNHHMFSEVDMWFYRHLAGIHYENKGEKVVIKPNFIKGIDWVKAEHRGVSVYWNKEEITISSDLPIELVIDGAVKNLDAGTHSIKR